MVAKGWDQHGEPVVIEGTEFLARAVQHETDHLDGILFIDRLDPVQRKAAMREIREAEWVGGVRPVDQVGFLTFGRGSSLDETRVCWHARGCLPSLDALIQSSHDVVAVVTRPDAPAGRGRSLVPSPVRVRAQEHGIPVLTPKSPREPEFLDALNGLAPDCAPVVAYDLLGATSSIGDPDPWLDQSALFALARLAWGCPGATRGHGRR